MTILLSSVLSAINPLLAQATFPGEKIIFGNRGQSNEHNNETLVKAYNLATQKNYEQALTLINEEIKTSPKLATLYVIKGLVLNEMGSYLIGKFSLKSRLEL